MLLTSDAFSALFATKAMSVCKQSVRESNSEHKTCHFDHENASASGTNANCIEDAMPGVYVEENAEDGDDLHACSMERVL